jgi:membrane-bound lytic murein transglycosylase D
MSRLTGPIKRIARRAAYPALATGMVLSTVVAGLNHSSYLVQATGTTAALKAVAPLASPANSTAANTASLATTAGLDLDLKHAKIDQWVTRLTTSLRGDFSTSLSRMDKYAGMINAKLDAKQMPRELIYLALIESDFNPNAKSKVGAVGMWQFMSATARQLGLTVKGKTDERKNPAESTDAALSYLSDLHDRFGSWYLAAAAYNSGAGTVSKALMKVTGKTQGTDEDFFRILSALPRETQDYVPKLIASARVGSNPAQYGMDGGTAAAN